MKAAIVRTNQLSGAVIQLACAVAITLMLTVLVTVGLSLLTPTSAAAPAIRPAVPTAMPTIAPANYLLPSEPVDYNDPNYIGSYGG